MPSLTSLNLSNPLPYYSVFAADRLRCDLDLWPLTLNICSVSKLVTEFERNRAIRGRVTAISIFDHIWPLQISCRINLAGQSVNRFGGASTIFTVKTDDLLSCCFNVFSYTFSSMIIFTFALWWGLQCGGASCARAHCAHWIIRPWDHMTFNMCYMMFSPLYQVWPSPSLTFDNLSMSEL